MTPYLAVAGTHEIDDKHDWMSDGPLVQFLEAQGLVNLCKQQGVKPFVWTTDLEVKVSQRGPWSVGGQNLLEYLVPPLWPGTSWPAADTRLFTHSHGLQVALYACAMGLKVDVLFDLAGPVRADMESIAKLARPNIRRWVHVYSDYTDKWQWLGELGDGHFGIVRQHPLADRNVKLPDAGHSGLLDDQRLFHFWTDSRADGAILTAELKGLVR